MENLNDRINLLESQIASLQLQLQKLVDGVQLSYPNPVSKTGLLNNNKIAAIDIKTGFGNIKGNGIIWNSSELKRTPINKEPTNPETIIGAKGYNKHSHSRFSGGALIKDVLEIVEYDWNSVSPAIDNKHSQQYWNKNLKIATQENTKKETIDKIGLLDLIFNPDTKTWGVSAYEIDVKKCYLVQRDDEGNIALDSKGQQKKSPLFNSDINKTSILWDENSATWRLLAVYAPGE